MAPSRSRQPLRPLQPRHVGETACLLHSVGHSSVCIPACNRQVTGACPLPCAEPTSLGAYWSMCRVYMVLLGHVVSTYFSPAA